MMWKRETTQSAQALRTIASLCVLFSSPQTWTYLHCKPAWTGTSSGEFYLSHELIIAKNHFLITNVRSKKMTSTCVLVLNFTTLKDSAESSSCLSWRQCSSRFWSYSKGPSCYTHSSESNITEQSTSSSKLLLWRKCGETILPKYWIQARDDNIYAFITKGTRR